MPEVKTITESCSVAAKDNSCNDRSVDFDVENSTYDSNLADHKNQVGADCVLVIKGSQKELLCVLFS
jgi:hypothetical protein